MAGRTEFDVIVAGGGMVGTVTALALAPLDLTVAMVEPVPRGAAAQPSFDDRSTALSRSSQRLFSALGLWPAIEPAAAAIRHIHISDQGRFGFSHIDAGQQRVDALGHVVVNRVLGEVLQEALRLYDSVRVVRPASIVGVRHRPGIVCVDVTGDTGESFELGARLLVVADGAHSPVRGLLGIGAEQRRYAQHAIVGNLRTGRPIGDTAYERFTAQGPLAVLPMVGNRAAFVWTVPEHDAARVAGLGDDAFLSELQAAFGTRLGGFEHVGLRNGYPLFLSKSLRITAPQSALVGNAAHGLHPVAAQGFNLGLRDVAALVDCIADGLGEGNGARLIGDATVLDRYAAWRRADQMKLVSFTDGLARLFTTPRAPLRTFRDVGMLAFDLVPGARREFARHTMGLAGRLPRLSRGVALR
jgi:2-octaprenyl-6-methoxyphenol hydroxylase